MKCEYFEGCPVYQNAGETACKIHFCNDTCPPMPTISTATGTTGKDSTAGTFGATANAPAKKHTKRGEVRRSLGEGGKRK